MFTAQRQGKAPLQFFYTLFTENSSSAQAALFRNPPNTGTGFKSHNGAATGALARARITPAQRRQIGHGNLDRLTGLGPKYSIVNIHDYGNMSMVI